jgi:hypothetical protein
VSVGSWLAWSVDLAVEDGGDLGCFVDEFGEFAGDDRLHAVGEGFFGFVVDFDEEAVATDCDCGERQGKDFVAFAGAVRGIDHDRQVAAAFDGGDDCEIQRVAREVGKSTDAAFAESDLVVSFGEDVFGGHEKFVERGGHAALEEDGFFRAAGAFEQREILHVARADLDDVGVLLDEIERLVVDGLGDDAEAVFFANFGENFEAGLAESLEGIRGSARFIGAAAEEFASGFGDLLGDGHALGFGLNGAGAGDERDVGAANEDVAARRGDAEDGVFSLGVAADELVGLANRDALDDAGKRFENAEIDGAVVAGDADGGAGGSGDGMGFEAEAFDAQADGADLLLGGMGLHDDQHFRYL